MTDQCPHDLLRTINRRWECLQAIVEQPQEKRELVETLSTPRSTLDAIVRELEQASLVEYREGRWEATITGRSAADVYADCTDTLASIHAAGTLLDSLSGTPTVPAAVLEDAETFVASDPVPDAVLVEFLDRVAAADRVRGVAPRALSGYTDRVFTRAVESGTTLEMVLAESVLAQLSALDPERVADRLTHERFSAYSGPIDVEFGLWIAEEPTHMGLIVYAERGIDGLLVNDSSTAVEWASDRYESVREAASPVGPRTVERLES